MTLFLPLVGVRQDQSEHQFGLASTVNYNLWTIRPDFVTANSHSISCHGELSHVHITAYSHIKAELFMWHSTQIAKLKPKESEKTLGKETSKPNSILLFFFSLPVGSLPLKHLTIWKWHEKNQCTRILSHKNNVWINWVLVRKTLLGVKWYSSALLS